ncbi:MAG: tRNA pseudouridine(55) synthase TruB [Pseudomonadota bacterium]|nr:tRNA pseudouridine(55) synthase TruB [Pseudomonadota bacterium]
MARKRRGNPIDGILLIDKPQGMSSNQVLQRAKRLLNAQKAGHTGALDPIATGVLPICLGEATKLSQYWLDADKSYQVTAKLGEVTDTLDSEGEVLKTTPVPDLSESDIQAVLADFTGEIGQIPPMYSALKHQGKPLYELAREGIEIERKARTITIYQLELIDWQPPMLTLRIDCSKGTYVRTLVDDIGNVFNCGAHVVKLRRLKAGPFQLDDCQALEAVEALSLGAALQTFLPIHTAVQDWVQCHLDKEQTQRLMHGHAVFVEQEEASPVALFEQGSERFLGVGEVKSDAKVYPKRLIRSPESQ